MNLIKAVACIMTLPSKIQVECHKLRAEHYLENNKVINDFYKECKELNIPIDEDTLIDLFK